MAKPAKTDVARNREEAEQLLARIGDLYSEITRLGLDYGAQVADLKLTYERQIEPLQAEIETAEAKVRAWCAANRASICKVGSKSAKLATGTVRWRLGRARVVIADPERVLERIKALGLMRFVRSKEEINQQALLAEPQVAETIPGVSIVRPPEEIILEPVRQNA